MIGWSGWAFAGLGSSFFSIGLYVVALAHDCLILKSIGGFLGFYVLRKFQVMCCDFRDSWRCGSTAESHGVTFWRKAPKSANVAENNSTASICHSRSRRIFSDRYSPGGLYVITSRGEG